MQRKILFFLAFICLFGISLASDHERLQDHAANSVEVLKALSSRVRVSDSHEERAALKEEIKILLRKLPDRSEIADQVSFALDITDGTGMIQELEPGFVYAIKGPSSFYVVMEKLHPVNIEMWKKYSNSAENLEFLKISASYEKSGGQINDWPKDYSFVKYLKTQGGLSYFIKRIEEFNPSKSYDIWISYVTRKSPQKILQQRKIGLIDPEDLQMIMSIQAGAGLDTYSPMGITRTIAEAKAMSARELRGEEPQEKLSLPLSVWFHLLSAKIVKSLYPSVNNFLTTPIESMKLILAQALNPCVIFPVKDGMKKAPENLKKIIQMNARKSIPYFATLPWLKDHQFISFKIQISIDDLLHCAFPYFSEFSGSAGGN